MLVKNQPKNQPKNLVKKGILIAFGELFLKSEGVKKLFQKRLVQNLCFFLARQSFAKQNLGGQEKQGMDFKVRSFRERIFIETEQIMKASKIIKRVFGIVWIAESFCFPEITLKEFSDFIAENYPKWIKKNETFAVRLKLEKGLLEKSREEVINEIAENIKRKVDLTKPKKEIFIEIRKKAWFLYFKKTKGTGGLPGGSSGKVLSLISGGIDSPVAAYLIAKRGAENIWLHFHSVPLVSRASIEKVKELAKVFLNYQPELKIYFVPFQKAQLEIKAKIPLKYRILLYRRLMLKIGEKIAEKEKCQVFVTGESLGQVASQTLPNIKIIGEATKLLILRPLIGQDKEETINLARKMGTFEISIKPHEDCCLVFAPKPQTAKGKIEIIEELEKRLDSAKIIREIIKEVEVERY